MDKILLTPRQFDQLKKEIQEVREEIDRLAYEINKYAAMGDLSENAEYQYAKNRQRVLFARLEELNEKINNAVVIQGERENKDEIAVGTTVKVKDLDTGEEEVFHLVGSGDFDFEKGEIPASGPLGKGLLGHKVGDVVELELPHGTQRVEILSVEDYSH